jgi:hypothetical protein
LFFGVLGSRVCVRESITRFPPALGLPRIESYPTFIFITGQLRRQGSQESSLAEVG